MTQRKKDRIRRIRNGGSARQNNPGKYDPQWTEREKEWIDGPNYSSADEVPRDILERALTQKLPWIKRFVSERCPRGKLVEFARLHAESAGIAEDDIPPYSTLHTWVHQYRQYGVAGLADKVRTDAGIQQIDPEVLQVIEALRIGGKVNPGAATSALVRLLDLPHNKTPKYGQVRRAIRRVERRYPGLIELVDNGQAGWRNRFRFALAGGLQPGGQTYAVDSTVADITVRVRDPSAPEGWKEGRVALTVIMDVGSRMILTFNLSLYAVDSGILSGVFRRVINPEANYPGLLSPGWPRAVRVDPGAEHQGEFRKLLDQHGVEIQSTTPNTPEENGRAERLIGTIQTEVFSPMPGYVKTQSRFDPYAPPENEAKQRFSKLKYEPHRLEVPVEMLPRIEEVELELLGWAHAYNAMPHSRLPTDSDEFRRLAAQAEWFEELWQQLEVTVG